MKPTPSAATSSDPDSGSDSRISSASSSTFDSRALSSRRPPSRRSLSSSPTSAWAASTPSPGSSALANRWLWGPGGCQLYSFAGFLFGNYQLIIVNLVAFDRFVLVCKPKWGLRLRTYKTYARVMLLSFFVSLVFAVLPLAGFPGYGIMATRIACTIDFMNPSNHFSSYITAMLIALYIIPYSIGIFCTYRTLHRLGQPDPPAIHFASHTHYSRVPLVASSRPLLVLILLLIFQTLLGCMIAVPIAFSSYGINCVWAFVGSPRDIPRWMIPLPPLAAKLGGIINPLFYIYAHPLHWALVRRLFGLKHDSRLVNQVEEENEAEDEERARRQLRLRELEEAQEMVAHSSSHHKI